MEEEKVIGTHRVVTIHGDTFVCFTPALETNQQGAHVLTLEGWHVIGNSWYGGSKKKVELLGVVVRYVERGEYRFGQSFAELPPLPRT